MTATMARLALGAAFLALVACGGEPQQQASPPETGAPAPSATAEPDAAPVDPDIAAGQIPKRFLGVWDAVTGTCDPASDLRMDIAPRRIEFYESVGNVTGMGSESSAAIADLAMAGEGETWVQSLKLTIETTPEGERLIVSDALDPAAEPGLPRKRCPA